MSSKRTLYLTVPAVLLVVCLAASLATRGAMANLQFLRSRAGASGGEIVDQQPLETAKQLLPLAITAEEQAYAREGFRLADHEVDQAFAQALRQAAMEGHALTGKALEAQPRAAALQATVKQDQASVDGLKARQAAAGGNDDLDLAKAQLALDTDELTDAVNNLAVVSGDKRAKIQEELATHEAGMKKYDDHTAVDGQVATISTKQYGTLAGRLKAWGAQGSRAALLTQAKAQAEEEVISLTAERGRLQGTATPVIAALGTSLAQLRRLDAQRSILTILNDRIENERQLAENYGKWMTQLDLQHRIVRHLLLNSLAWIALIAFCAAFGIIVCHMVIDTRMAGRGVPERRSLLTLRTVLQFGIEAVGLLAILLVVFGPPSQVPTILGLATAGLTVVFQDHILAFFGWFVLMSRNGIRVGDWVEIAGVGGEVVEVGLFRTTLLETGNWTDKGHPTGRRISFVNKFAMSGQYFNFSTDGQWMWDEITVNLPANEDVFALVERMQEALSGETAMDTAEAESEWQQATQRHGLSQFSAKPTVEMRPAAAGVDVVIRYVTRAADRLEMRNRLSQAVIRLLHVPGPAAPALAAANA